MASDGNSSTEDYDEMKNLVLSLSKAPTDEDRRARLASIFEEALARPNNQPKQFAALFEEALTNIGNEVQAEAKKRFAEKEKDNSDSESKRESNELEGERVKTEEELLLWALVDMMVQSKTIVKKASGELGSKGTFQ